jgi:hypothetical protein
VREHASNRANCDASRPSTATVLKLRNALQMVFSTICQLDYESFTDSWLPADMNAGGRAPRLWACLRRPQPWDDPEMTETSVCRL